MKPYALYKDSGVAWLGEVPEHWEVGRLKSRASNVIEQTAERQSGELYVALEHVESWTGRVRHADSHVTFDSQLKRFRAQDVLFGKLRPYLAKVARPSRSGVCVGEFFVLRPRHRDLRSDYLEHLLRSKPVVDAVSSSTFGAKMPRADWLFVGDLALSFPPFPEQSAIVRFIDHADRSIRRYIRTKQKLIKLLEEQKQAVIHGAVTRGVNPNVRLKPSGAEWLGDVPEHWDVLRSKYIFREVDDRSVVGEETRLSMSQKHGLIRSSEIEEHRLVSESYVGAKLCDRGDLVLNRLKAHLGVFALAQERGLVSPDYTVFRSVRRIEPRYFEAVYRTPACRVVLRQRAKGIVQGFWRLYTDDFYDIRMPVPPFQEQSSIIAALDGELAMPNSAIARTEHEIKLLREYRTRLIADVVTGKLDVREAAARLPEQVEEQWEPLDEAAVLAADEEEAGDADVEAASEKVEV